MRDLLPHYERELAFLRTHAGEFALRNPKIAGSLLPGAEGGEDPHVQRLVESFALLSARVHKRLDDDFPLFTESFLEVLYPHYLRPFPSCSIACLQSGETAAQTSVAKRIPRGTMLDSRPVHGVTCRFRTAYDVDLLPVRVVSAAFRSGLAAPAGSSLPREAGSAFSIELELTSPQASWADLGVRTLRFCIDGDPARVSALREALCHRVLAVLAETATGGPWLGDEVALQALPRGVGFAEDEALIDFDARSHPAYRLLTEYFAFPDKFDFVDLPLPAAVPAASARRIVLHAVMPGWRAGSDEARLLETVDARHLLLGCTPVVNLAKRNAEPIRVTHATAGYTVLPDARRAYGHEVYSIDKVYRLQRTPQGETIAEFKPFYSLQHDDLLGEGEAPGRYWSAHRDEALAERSPGHELQLSIVDIDADPAHPRTDTLSIELTATNRDLPKLLSIGNPGGDLFLEGGGGVAREIRLIRRPTASSRFERGRGALWRLISHLSLNHLSLSAGGIDALREWMRLYDLPRSATNARQIAGLAAIDYRPASACLPGNPFPTFVRGMEVRLSVDETSFAGSGLRLFAQVLDRFFGLYVHANSFCQLRMVSARTQETLVACPPRSGDSPLL